MLRTTLAKLHPFFPELAHLSDLDPAVEVLILREIVRAILTHIFHLRDDVSLLIGVVALHAASLVLAFNFLENKLKHELTLLIPFGFADSVWVDEEAVQV